VSGRVNIGEPSGGTGRPRALPSSNSPSYDIAPNVYVCVTGDGSVLLDLKHDKYLGLGRRETEWVAALVDAWPRPKWDAADCDAGAVGAAAAADGLDDAPIDQVRIRELFQSLAEAGLLIRNGSKSAPRSQRSVTDMRAEWISIGDELEVSSNVTVAHVTSFLKAYGRSRFSLAWRPFAATVEIVRARKSRRGRGPGRDREPEPSNLVQLAALVGIFRRLRPFVFAAEGRCLLHALTLINFMARYDFYPEWVIGVATQPWGAHSWVQWGRYLLDSNPEKVCRFTPILVV
jgi:Transglutaminase-like superfamily